MERGTPNRLMPTLSPYQPTLRDAAANKLLQILGDSPEAQRFVGRLLGSTGLGNNGPVLADFTGLTLPFQAEEAGREIASGHPVSGGVNLLLTAAPVPVAKAAAKSGAKVVNKLFQPDGASAPLDMSPAARMARAAEQGFNLPVYHGSRRPTAEPSLPPTGDVGIRMWGDGFYTTTSRERAAEYAAGADAVGPNILPMLARTDGSLPVDNVAGRFPQTVLREMGLPEPIGVQGQARLTEELRRRGYKGVLVRHPGGELEFVTFAPANVRSVFDDFHPGGEARVATPRASDFSAAFIPLPVKATQ